MIDWIQMFGPTDLKCTLSYGMVPDWEVCLKKAFNLRSLSLWFIRCNKAPFEYTAAEINKMTNEQLRENLHDVLLKELRGVPIDLGKPEVQHGYAIYPQGGGNWYQALARDRCQGKVD